MSWWGRRYDVILDRLDDINANVELVIRLLRQLPTRRRVFLFVVGLNGDVQMASFTINPGQKKTLTAVFSDDTGKSEPLAAVPVPQENAPATGFLTFTPQGTPTPADGTFKWDVLCDAKAPVGQAFDVSVPANNPDGTPITVGNDIQGSAIAPDNTHVTLSVG